MRSTQRVLAASSSVLVLASLALAHDGDPKLRDKQPAYMGRGWRNASLASPSGGPGVAMLGAPGATFPHHGITLLAWVSLADLGLGVGENGNSCYGYTSPSGREYALLGHSSGTAIVEVTRPGDPQIVTQVAGPHSLWRDVRTYSHYAYAISEGGSGIQVIDLANVDAGSASLVNVIDDDATHATHTLTVDTVSGYLYRSGGGPSGLRIYDVGANAVTPPRVGTWSPRYVHEPSVFTYTSGPAAGKQIAFCCGGLNGGTQSTGLYVVDVTNKASPTQLQFVSYPNAAYAHQCWPSPDRHWLYLDDELDDENLGVTSTIRVFDISNPLAVTYSGTFTNRSPAIDHNLYTKNDLVYQAAYRSGLRIYKTSAPGTPTSPVEVAWFDTWPGDDLAYFNGLWNVYPYFPSGTVIGSDLEKGLFVWWVGAAPIDFAIAGGPPSSISPAGTTLRVTSSGPLVVGTAALHFDAGGGETIVPMTSLGGASLAAELPALPCGTRVAYWFTGETSNGVTWSVPSDGAANAYSTFARFGASTALAWDFEASAGGWTAGVPGDTATSGTWTRANPNGTAAQPEDDHTSGGTQCFVTGQGAAGGGIDAADVDGGRTTLLSARFDARNVASATIHYWRWFSNDQGGAQDDVLAVDLSNDDGATWMSVEVLGPSGDDCVGGWREHEFLVSDLVTPTDRMRVRFVAGDTGWSSTVEAAVDDVELRALACSGFTSACAGDGSIAACPCGNQGASGAGCASSAFASGALLAASGTPSVAADSVVLASSSMTGGTCIFFQGDASMAPLAVDDGLGCVAGSIVRLATKPVLGAASDYPQAGDLSIAVRGLVPGAGAVRWYQCFYRNAVASFCPPSTSNRTNAVAIVWAP